MVLDPFCGRGTTNFAARLLGQDTVGIDCNEVAVAATAAKLVTVRPEEVVEEARHILASDRPSDVPTGEFWEHAYHTTVLESLCRLRVAYSTIACRPLE